jgi:hypothetical protein
VAAVFLRRRPGIAVCHTCLVQALRIMSRRRERRRMPCG